MSLTDISGSQRHKFKHEYLLRLIACYRQHFADGKMLPQSLIFLIDSARKSLDSKKASIDDWQHVSRVYEGTWSLKMLSWSRRNYCFAKPIKWLFFERLLVAYDTLVNYYDCHEETLMLLKHANLAKDIETELGQQVEASRKAALRIIRKDMSAVFPDLVHSIN